MQNTRRRPSCFALLMMATYVVCAQLGSAQLTTGKIVGTVKDSSGAVVPKVLIKALNTETKITRETVSSDVGTYELLLLPPGRYELSAERATFKRYVRRPVTVEVNQGSRVDVELQIGVVSQTAEVAGEAIQVQSTTATLGKVMSEKLIEDLPLNGRNFSDLGLLQNGVAPIQPGRGFTLNAYNVNGARDSMNNFLLDGVANSELEGNTLQIKPAVDALAEFKIQTNLFSAEYGRNSGAVVNAVIKSGTDSFHGALWEFLRNDRLDAKDFFANNVSPLKRNQFGGDIGGPILKDRSFFFFSYEGFRERRGVTQATTVPNDAHRAGVFGASAQIKNPTNSGCTAGGNVPGTNFVGGTIPDACISPVAKAILKLYPQPNAGGENFTSSPSAKNDSKQFILRIDHLLRKTDQIFGRYIYDNNNQVNPFQPGGTAPAQFPGFSETLINRNQNFAFGYTHTFSTNLLNDFHAGFSRTYNPTAYPNTPKPKDVGINFPVPDNVGLTDIRITGYSGVGNTVQGPFRYVFNTYQYHDTLILVHGKHTVKTGGEVRWHQENVRYQYTEAGNMLFTGNFTGNGLADFLLGESVSFTYGSLRRDVLYQRWKAFSVFGQDDLRVTAKLTLNLGLRWEYTTPMIDKNGQTSTVFIDKQPTFGVPGSGVATTVLAGDKSRGLCDKCGYFPDKRGFQPQLGFAYDVFGNGKWAVRGGYGIFFTEFGSNLVLQNLLQPPFTTFPTVTDSGGVGFVRLADPTCGGTCVPPGSGLVVVTDPHIRTSYMQQYNLTLQHELGAGFLLEAGYVGTLGRKLLNFRDRNQPFVVPVNGQPPSESNLEQRRPFPGFGSLFESKSWGNSSYSALITNINKRFSNGFTFLTGYTWSKCIDQASQFHSGGGSVIDPFVPQDEYNLAAERGLCAFDVPHRFTFSGSIELPFGSGKRFLNRRGLTDKLVGGWRMSPIVVLSHGVPLTVRDNSDPCLTRIPFFASCRPNRVGDPNLDNRTPNNWINKAAFQVQPLGTFGNAGRGILFADGAENVDLNFAKVTGITERTSLEFRAEFYNLFNHPQFGVPDLDFSAGNNPNFGKIFSTARFSNAREIQFGLKLYF
jgi:Carboxypeptidase regulatory-like domain/TonB dependent receptor-like, beta-barrel